MIVFSLVVVCWNSVFFFFFFPSHPAAARLKKYKIKRERFFYYANAEDLLRNFRNLRDEHDESVHSCSLAAAGNFPIHTMAVSRPCTFRCADTPLLLSCFHVHLLVPLVAHVKQLPSHRYENFYAHMWSCPGNKYHAPFKRQAYLWSALEYGIVS